ncbi:hypothetical protein [Pseudonocardia acaciae]|uniref:hypothetical protein n=1 Tax=Pseudonocardia acaciae TaxID=551276 RepID=UPI0012ED424B|nr:hypothetical protein [Pseudonocardia acaciae]
MSLQVAQAPMPRTSGAPQALSPHPSTPAPRLPEAAAPAAPPSVDVVPANPVAPSPAARPGPGAVLSARDLVGLATSPLKKGTVKVPVAEPVQRVVKRVTTKKPVKRVVRDADDVLDNSRARTRVAKSIGNKFGTDMARRFAGQFGGPMARQAFDSYAAGGYSGMDDYVGRHRAE